jgi:hypothetical protein
MAEKKKYDMNSPEAKAVIDEIVHGTFLTEGSAVAFPLCFPGASSPIPPDESHIPALDVSPEGIVYGGTSGVLAHLFVGMFHGVTGVVFDLGGITGAQECVSVCCAKEKVVACVNGPDGGRIITCPIQPLPFDLIQEWGFTRPEFEDIGPAVPNESIVHAVLDGSRERLIGATESTLFSLEIASGKITRLGAISVSSRLAVGDRGGVFGLDESHSLFHCDPDSRSLTRKAVLLPEGSWSGGGLRWAKDPRSGALYTSDDSGNLFAFTEARGFSGPLGKAPLMPVGPMAVTFDGRLFGSCGDGIGKLFSYEPRMHQVKNLGVIVSVLERRRYGYQFGAAAVGRDGQIYLGENDNLGHLWIYFPRISASPA